ncbi:MAG TPA: flagellar filament capping protein FliD [Patescibacteria group bacterium]|nr:flagellar filament capping protein FliD [Patescibacteria group bacterium]
MVTRIGGLATGIDTDTQVKEMLKGRQTQLDTLKQKQQLVYWQQEDLQTIYSSLSDFRNTVTDFKLQRTLAAKKATSTDEDAITATPTANAATGTHVLTVSKLPTGVTKVSSATIADAKDTLALQFGLTSDFTMGINGTSFNVSKEWSLNDFATALSYYGGITASYDSVNKKFSMVTTTTGAYDSTGGARLDFAGSDATAIDFIQNKLKIDLGGGRASIGKITDTDAGYVNTGSLASQFGALGNFDLVINGQTISTTVSSTTTLSSVISAINTQMTTVSAAITASYNTTTDRVFIVNTDGTSTSAGTAITFGTSGAKPANYAAGLNFLINDLRMDVPFAVASDTQLAISASSTQTVSSVFGITSSMSIEIDGTTPVTINPTDTIDTVVASLTASGYTANFDSTTKRFVLYRDSAGTTALDFNGTNAAGMQLLNKLGLITPLQTTVPTTRTSSSAMSMPTTPTSSMATDLGMSTDSFAVSVNGKSVTIDPTQSLATALAAISSTSGAGVSATYDSTAKTVTITRTDGSTSPIDFSGSSAAGYQWLTNNLNLMYTSPSSYALQGTDAKLTFDGIDTTSHTTSYVKNDVTYKLKAVTTNPVTVAVEADTETILASVKKFVESYNALLKQLSSAYETSRPKTSSSRYASYYEPLTDDQKDAMDESTITKWEAKARTGLLHNDSTLMSMVSQMRSDFTNPVVRYPTAALNDTATNGVGGLTLDFNEPLYKGLGGGVYSALPTGTDVTSRFQYTGKGTVDKITYNIVDGTPQINVAFKAANSASTPPVYAPAVGDTIQLKTDSTSTLYNSRGASYVPRPATLSSVLNEDATDSSGNAVISYDTVWTYPTDNVTNYGKVDSNAWMTAASIGISTDSGGGYLDYEDGGKLYINETTLKSALESDPNILQNIFATKSTTTDRQGIAERLYAHATTQLKALSDKAGVSGASTANSALDKVLSNYETRIETLEDIMADEEDRYYDQFARMEEAVSKLNQQGTWLSSATSSSSG